MCGVQWDSEESAETATQKEKPTYCMGTICIILHGCKYKSVGCQVKSRCRMQNMMESTTDCDTQRESDSPAGMHAVEVAMCSGVGGGLGRSVRLKDNHWW